MTGTNGTTPKEIDLDALPDDAGFMKIKGERRRVLQLDGNGWKVYDKIRGIVLKAREGEAPPDAISTEEFYGLAIRCLPDESPAFAWSLNAQKAGMVIAFAAATLEAVEETIPKSDGPTEGETPTPSSA